MRGDEDVNFFNRSKETASACGLVDKTATRRRGSNAPLRRRWRRRLVVVAVGLAAMCLPVNAEGAPGEPYDAFPSAEQLNAGYSEFNRTIGYDSTFFELEPGETAACPSADATLTAYGKNTGWFGFLSHVSGKLSLKVSTPPTGYGAIVILYTGVETFAKLSHVDCSYETNTRLASVGPITVSADTPYKIQTAGTYAFYRQESGKEETRPAPYGAPSALEVKFTPDDTDGDGVPDTLDVCPTTPGNQANGCPPADTDGDGVLDGQDKCPTQRGPAAYGGCPDTDGDGTPDYLDRCPAQKGSAALSGCPDSDNDAIPDVVDVCPYEFAIRAISTAGDGRLGCLEPLGANLPYNFGIATNHGALLTAFSVEAPAGSHVSLSCRGRGCPRSFPAFTTTKPTTSLLPFLHRGKLRRGKKVWVPVGAKITATVTHVGALGRRRTLAPHKRTAPTRSDACVAAAGVSIRCP
jgi:hypothetical protein